MLSLASNISATQAVEAKYSASFDGTDDFIDTGHHFSDVFNDSFTISFWAKPTDGHDTQSFFGANDSDADIIRGEIKGSGDFKLTFEADGDPGEYQTDNVVFSDGQATSWTHILITATKASSTAVVVYVNGTAVDVTAGSNVAEAKHAAFSSAQNLTIGANNEKGTVGGFFTGGIDEFAIFNVALDADAAAAIYNGGSPLNLTFNQGNYDNSSALQAYYRMGNGLFDNKANGVVHDQDNPGFGSDLVTNGDFSNGLTGIGFRNVTIVDGAAKIDNTGLSGDNSYIIFPSSGTIGVVGNVYKLMYDIVATNGQTLTVEGTGSNEDLETDTVGIDRVKYFRFTKSDGRLVIKRKTGGGVTTNVTIDNIRFFKLNGNPALTSGNASFSSDTP